MKFLFPKALSFVPSTPAVVIQPINPVSQILNEAADVIEKNGLAQGTYEIVQGRMCAAVAIGFAIRKLGFKENIYKLRWKVEFALADYLKIRQGSIPTWNDNLYIFPQTRVVRALRKAARVA